MEHIFIINAYAGSERFSAGLRNHLSERKDIKYYIMHTRHRGKVIKVDITDGKGRYVLLRSMLLLELIRNLKKSIKKDTDSFSGYSGYTRSLSVSSGYGIYDENECSAIQDVLSKADAEMYRIKRARKGAEGTSR